MEFKTTTIELALAATGRQPLALPEISGLAEADKNFMIDNYNLVAVVEAINTESNGGKRWEPNYNSGETRYEPIFWIDASEEQPGGFAYSYTFYAYADSGTVVGSRFCFHSLAGLNHAVRIFKDLYLRVMTKQNPK